MSDDMEKHKPTRPKCLCTIRSPDIDCPYCGDERYLILRAFRDEMRQAVNGGAYPLSRDSDWAQLIRAALDKTKEIK